MRGEGGFLNYKVTIASNIKHIGAGTTPAENQVRSVIGNEKSEPPAEIHSKVFCIDKMIAGDQPILEDKDLIRGTQYVCDFRQAGCSVLNELYLIFRNRLVHGQALPYHRPTACQNHERKAHCANDTPRYCIPHKSLFPEWPKLHFEGRFLLANHNVLYNSISIEKHENIFADHICT